MEYLPAHIASFIKKKLAGELSEEESGHLTRWANEDPYNESLINWISSGDHLKNELQLYFKSDASQVASRLASQFPGFQTAEPAKQVPVHRTHFLRSTWFRVAAAAILFLGVGSYFLLRDTQQKPVLTQKTRSTIQKDILPGKSRATLVLGDESIIELDTAKNGLLATQGESEVIKTENGEIFYVGTTKALNNNGAVYYQKLITPRGGTYQVTLPDGTQAWLNAESSIRFPNVFNGNTRSVEITGEVYFEVEADKSKPFIVKAITDEIMVLGTRFNINSYRDEPFTKTSLLNGSVKVNQQILKPGESYTNGNVQPTNIEQDIAWKNGWFNFHQLTLRKAMSQISRWYDVSVLYEGSVKNIELYGRMGRDLNLSQVLDILSDMEVKFVFDPEKKQIILK